MTALVSANRSVMVYGQLPDWAALGALTVASVAILAVSLLVFRALEDSFIDEA
ncbi:hypothetical protein D3C83_133220 [compost metagenome]